MTTQQRMDEDLANVEADVRKMLEVVMSMAINRYNSTAQCWELQGGQFTSDHRNVVHRWRAISRGKVFTANELSIEKAQAALEALEAFGGNSKDCQAKKQRLVDEIKALGSEPHVFVRESKA